MVKARRAEKLTNTMISQGRDKLKSEFGNSDVVAN
jgi:hypothetical protein